LYKPRARATIQFKQDISFRARHQPLRTEGIPTAEGTEADLQAASVQADSSDGTLLRDAALEHQGFAEAGAFASKSASHGNALGQVLNQAANQAAAIDAQAIGKYQDMRELFFRTT
jgi:hypothetical protein